MWRNEKSVVAYLTRMDKKYTTIVFGDGTVVDSLTRAAHYALAYLKIDDYQINGWRHWCVKVEDDKLPRIKFLEDRFVNTDSSSVTLPFDLFCTRRYNVGERSLLKMVNSPSMSYNNVKDLVSNLDVSNAKLLFGMKYYPTLHALGDIVGADQECTMSWHDNILENVLFPRRLLESHFAYTQLACSVRKRKSNQAFEGENMSYQDQIQDGKCFPLVKVVDTSDDEWVIRIRGNDDRPLNVTIHKLHLKGHPGYNDIFEQYNR